MTELLAPAGSIECAYAAIHSGADAIYLGSRAFSARASAENFDEEALSSLLRYAKLLGVKVFLAMNTLVKDKELPEFFDTLVRAWNLGVDAVILQDVLLGKYIYDCCPQICLHLSTQAGVCNESGAKFAKECGFSRVILARETPLSEIEKICKIIEAEVFVQGALCTCLSGQCYFSSFIGGNSGNRGRCKQPCRKQYSFDRQGYEEKAYALSPSDLCVGKKIEKLIAAGVSSFKIEGRMRRPEYVAAATAYYRNLLDGKGEDAAMFSALKRTYNRGNYTKGLAFGQDRGFLSRQIQGHLGESVGVVRVENKKYFVESRFAPKQGDAFKILRKGKEVGGAYFSDSGRRGFYITSSFRLCAGDSVFVTTDTALQERLLEKRRFSDLHLTLSFIEGKPAEICGGGISVVSSFVLEKAKSKPLTKEELKACFLKTDGLPLRIHFDEIIVEGEIFIAKSQLNELRRSFFAGYIDAQRPTRDCLPIFAPQKEVLGGEVASFKGIIATDFTGLHPDVAILKPDDYDKPLPESFLSGEFEKYLYCPAFCTTEELNFVFELIEKYRLDGVYAENFAALYEAKARGVRCFVGTGFNVTNGISAAYLEEEKTVSKFVLSKELSQAEMKDLKGRNKCVCFVGGDVKLMDLCYCPFEKNCSNCDKRNGYTMKDEQGRTFPVHRFLLRGKCRFEIYNGARLIATSVAGLADFTVTKDKVAAEGAFADEHTQKKLQDNYTYGHAKNGVL